MNGGSYDAHAPGDYDHGHQATAAEGWQRGADGRFHDQHGDAVVLRGGTDSADVTRARLAQTELPPLIHRHVAKTQLQETLNNQLRDSLDNTTQRLAKGLDVRPKPEIGATNYNNMDHKTMYDMVKNSVDPATTGAGGQSLVEAGNALTGLQQNGTIALNNSEAQWSGSAGESARRWTTELINYIGTQGVGMQLTGTQLSRQAAAASQAKNAMPEVVDYDPRAMNQQLQSMNGDPIALHTQAAQDVQVHAKAESARQTAAHVMQTYDNALGGSVTAPRFAAPPAMDGDGARVPLSTRTPGALDPSHASVSSESYLPVGGQNIGAAGPRGEDASVGGFGAGVGARVGPGAGARAGAGFGESADAARGGSTAEAAMGRSASRSGVMGTPAGRGKKKEEDAERYAPSYLVEPDPDEVFGCDIKTAPPVIGA